eukprot:CAMPEP_0171491134 /NCGR_PEP_ID=MMETSP0958-20121227/3692_1 /TAXON_ID=87120 /ORGANISM="Aurantiochytrium limacinum, Strain ATCCMYA-1381" /LENGTH=80 /DNA_ID=CAMNT_0012024521 /DNA_START=667 /DNA_END=909 /DNA_ORIENTATION=+
MPIEESKIRKIWQIHNLCGSVKESANEDGDTRAENMSLHASKLLRAQWTVRGRIGEDGLCIGCDKALVSVEVPNFDGFVG